MPIQVVNPIDRLLITSGVLNYAQAYSMAGWFKLQATVNFGRTFFSINDDSSAHDFIGALNSGLDPYNESEDGGSGGSPAYSVDTWYYIAVIASAAGSRSLRQYANAVMVADHGDDSSGRPAATRLEIGGYTSSNAHPGLFIVHDFRAWTVARTPAELADEMASTTPVHTDGLYGHWPTPLGANRLLDISGNNNHFTAVGSPVDVEDYPPGYAPDPGEDVEVDFTVDGQSTISADLLLTKPVAFTVDGQASISAALNLGKPLSLSIPGTANIAAELSLTKPLHVGIASESIIAVQLNVAKSLAFGVAGQSTLAFSLGGSFVQAGRRVRSVPRQHTVYSKRRDSAIESVPRSRGIKSRARST